MHSFFWMILFELHFHLGVYDPSLGKLFTKHILKSRCIGHLGDRNWSHVLLTWEAVHYLCVLCFIGDIYELNYLRSFDQDSWGQIVTKYLDNKRKGWERKEIFKLKLSPSAWITLYRRSLTLQAKCHLDLKAFQRLLPRSTRASGNSELWRHFPDHT